MFITNRSNSTICYAAVIFQFSVAALNNCFHIKICKNEIKVYKTSEDRVDRRVRMIIENNIDTDKNIIIGILFLFKDIKVNVQCD